MYGLNKEDYEILETLKAGKDTLGRNRSKAKEYTREHGTLTETSLQEEYQILQDTEMSILPNLFIDAIEKVTPNSPIGTIYAVPEKERRGIELWEICKLPTQSAKFPKSVEVDITKELPVKTKPPTPEEREQHDKDMAKWRQSRDSRIVVSEPTEHSVRLIWKKDKLHYLIGIIGSN